MTKRIAIIGPESTGKSELCQHLARIYQTEWVPEFARFYLDRLGQAYVEEDLLAIAQGQLTWEDDKSEYAGGYLFCDTDMIVMKVWSEHKYNRVHPWILDQLKTRSYDFHLLANIDLVWRPDPQREHPKLREYFFNLYRQYLEDHHLPYGIVSGIEEERTQCAKDLLESHFAQKNL